MTHTPTPGPWKRDRRNTLRGANGAPVSFTSLRLHMSGTQADAEEAAANTRLADKAYLIPEMEKALERIETMCREAPEHPVDLGVIEAEARSILAKLREAGQ